MSIGVLLITQTRIGTVLLKAAKQTYRHLPLTVKTCCIDIHTNPDNVVLKLKETIKDLDQGDGVLVLTDLYGSTPSNIAHQLIQHCQCKLKVIAGLNLPMLIKILNYPNLSLAELAQKALDGGKQGITIVEDNTENEHHD